MDSQVKTLLDGDRIQVSDGALLEDRAEPRRAAYRLLGGVGVSSTRHLPHSGWVQIIGRFSPFITRNAADPRSHSSRRYDPYPKGNNRR